MSDQKITFVNGKPAKCGCKMEFSSGGGHYSDVLYVTPCEAHSGSKPFGPSEVRRDGNGWWWHQGIPDFGGTEDPAPYHEWLTQQGLELREWSMERDLDVHPYFDGTVGCEGCIGWDPQSPGPEWFLLGIFDTEDGPHVQWARREVTP